MNFPEVLSQKKQRTLSTICAKCATSVPQGLRHDVRGNCTLECGLERHSSDVGLSNVPGTRLAPWAAGREARVSAWHRRTLLAPVKGVRPSEPILYTVHKTPFKVYLRHQDVSVRIAGVIRVSLETHALQTPATLYKFARLDGVVG